MKHPLAMRDFRCFWAGRLCAMLAQSVFVLSLGWAVYDVARGTHGVRGAALRLGLVGLIQFLPYLLLNPVTGLVADRFDRRLVVRLTLVAQSALLACIVLFALRGGTPLWLLYLVAAGFAAARAFYMPAMNALAPALVPAESLPHAIAAGAIAGRIGGVLGPVLGGYAYAVAPWVAYGLAMGLLVLALGCHLAIGPLTNRSHAPRGSVFVMMHEGLRYVLSQKLLLATISLDLFAVLFGGVTALLPVYARDILHIGPEGLGNLRASSSVGALATAGWLAWRPLHHHVGEKMLLAVAVYGISTIAFGLSTSMALSMVCLAVLGAADMVSVCVRQTLVQIHTPDDKRGRVSAISSLFISASNELGEMESGVAAALLGPVGAVVAGGIASVAVAALWARAFPQLRQARSFSQREFG